MKMRLNIDTDVCSGEAMQSIFYFAIWFVQHVSYLVDCLALGFDAPRFVVFHYVNGTVVIRCYVYSLSGFLKNVFFRFYVRCLNYMCSLSTESQHFK